MAIATDLQVQTYVNERVRPRAEQIRALILAMRDDRAAFADIFEALTQSTPTWTDDRDTVPHRLLGTDVLAWNTFLFGVLACVDGGSASDMQQAAPQLPVVLSACVRPL